MFVTAERS